MTSNMPYKDATSVALQLSPNVWGNIPLRACSSLIGGNGRVANPISMPGCAAAGVMAETGGDLIAAEATNTTALAAATRGWLITPANNKAFALGFPNCNADFTQKRRWGYEVCFAQATAADHGFIAGLTSRAAAGSSAFTASAIFTAGELVVNNNSFVGFRKPEDADIDIFYKPDQGSAGAIPTTAATGLHTTTAKTLADATFVKLGMNSDGRFIRFFVDNAQIGDAVSLDDAYLPEEADLIPIFSFFASSTSTVTMSWMAFAEAN